MAHQHAGAFLVAVAGPLAAAGPFTYLSSERYVEGWAECGPPGDPTVETYDRADAVGFSEFDVEVEVFADDGADCSISTSASHWSRLRARTMRLNGLNRANEGTPPNEARAWTHTRFDIEFLVTEPFEVPVYFRVWDVSGDDLSHTSLELHGAGVDISLGDGVGIDNFEYDALVAFQAGEVYRLTLDVAPMGLNNWVPYQLFIIPAPSLVSPVLMCGLALSPRRARCR